MLFCVADWEMIATLNTNEHAKSYSIVCLDQGTELNNNELTPNIIKKTKEDLKCIKHILKLYKTQDL